MLDIAKCHLLQRNPQYLTLKQMESLKKSIQRDGFLVPIVARPMNGGYEVISGNHRLLAAKELGHKKIPGVVQNMTKRDSRRIAINLNTIHGDPPAELMAPFLAELDEKTLSEIHLDDDMLRDIATIDEKLSETLKTMRPPEFADSQSVNSPLPDCKCPKCGRRHSSRSSDDL